jgi:glucose uptake protein
VSMRNCSGTGCYTTAVFVVHDSGIAIVFCVITMLGWGSWANTQKLSGKDRWPFELFYWDFAIGVLAFSLAAAFTLGSAGSAGAPFLENLRAMSGGASGRAIASGVLFNLANILLVVAIDAAGMSVAFPVGIGLALVIGTLQSYGLSPKGSVALLSTGVALIVFAMIMSALAYRRLGQAKKTNSLRGLAFSVVAGGLMGFFYPQLSAAISPDFTSGAIRPGLLTPYTALVLFSIGLLGSNLVFNTIFMRAGRVTYGEYFGGRALLHSLGFLGGLIWMLALSLNVLAAGVAGPAISYALGQGATLVAAIWGVFIWREFVGAPPGTWAFIALMFVGYVAGLVAIGAASL